MKSLILATLVLVSSAANASDLVITSSPYSVTNTMQRLETAVTSKGLGIFTKIDHAAGAKKAEMALPANQVLVFGNPKLGTLLMQKNPAIGLDLPMKIAIWQDKDGKTQVAYRSADAMAETYGFPADAKPIMKIRGALAGLVKAATAAQ